MKDSRLCCSRDPLIESTPPKACVFPFMRSHMFYEGSLEQAPDLHVFMLSGYFNLLTILNINLSLLNPHFPIVNNSKQNTCTFIHAKISKTF